MWYPAVKQYMLQKKKIIRVKYWCLTLDERRVFWNIRLQVDISNQEICLTNSVISVPHWCTLFFFFWKLSSALLGAKPAAEWPPARVYTEPLISPADVGCCVQRETKQAVWLWIWWTNKVLREEPAVESRQAADLSSPGARLLTDACLYSQWQLSAVACAPSSQLSDSQSCSVCVEKQKPGASGSAAAAAAAATCGAQETKGFLQVCFLKCLGAVQSIKVVYFPVRRCTASPLQRALLAIQLILLHEVIIISPESYTFSPNSFLWSLFNRN